VTLSIVREIMVVNLFMDFVAPVTREYDLKQSLELIFEALLEL